MIIAFLLVSLAWTASPSDISFLHSTVYSEGGLPLEQIQKKLMAYNLQIVEKIARERGYPTWFGQDNAWIRFELDRMLSEALSTNPSRKELYDITIQTFSGYYAEEAMARAVKAPSVIQPKNTEVGVLAASAQISQSGNRLKIDMDRSTIAEDVGFIGSGNGVLEKGESASLSLYFENTASERLYSTSLYLTEIGNCLFSPNPKDKEFQLPELDSEKGVVYTIPLYISSACSSGSYTIKLKAYDSVYFSSTPHYYTITLKPQSAGPNANVQLDNIRLDGDDYGHSEPSYVKPIMPEDRFELRMGVSLRLPNIEHVQQTFYIPTYLQPAYTSLKQPVTYSNGIGNAKPQDDVDMIAPAKEALKEALKEPSEYFRWTEQADAKILVAVDTRASQKVSSWHIPAQTESVSQIDADAFDQQLQRYLKVDVLTVKKNAELTDLEGYVVRPISAASRGELLSALQSTVNASGQTVVRPEQNGSIYRNYTFRHYFELPIFWEPEPEKSDCYLSATPQVVSVGGKVSLSGSVTHMPSDSVIRLTEGGRLVESYTKAQLLTTGQSTGFMLSHPILSDRPYYFTLQLTQSEQILCSSKKNVRIDSTKPTKPSREPESEEKKDFRFTSVEVGSNIGDSNYATQGSFVRAAFGKSFRIQTGLLRIPYSYGSFENILTGKSNGNAWMIGAQWRQILNKSSENSKLYVELSESLMFTRYPLSPYTLGLDPSVMISPSMTFTVHSYLGAYLQVAPFNIIQSTFIGPSVSFGLGVYF